MQTPHIQRRATQRLVDEPFSRRVPLAGGRRMLARKPTQPGATADERTHQANRQGRPAARPDEAQPARRGQPGNRHVRRWLLLVRRAVFQRLKGVEIPSPRVIPAARPQTHIRAGLHRNDRPAEIRNARSPTIRSSSPSSSFSRSSGRPRPYAQPPGNDVGTQYHRGLHPRATSPAVQGATRLLGSVPGARSLPKSHPSPSSTRPRIIIRITTARRASRAIAGWSSRPKMEKFEGLAEKLKGEKP